MSLLRLRSWRRRCQVAYRCWIFRSSAVAGVRVGTDRETGVDVRSRRYVRNPGDTEVGADQNAQELGGVQRVGDGLAEIVEPDVSVKGHGAVIVLAYPQGEPGAIGVLACEVDCRFHQRPRRTVRTAVRRGDIDGVHVCGVGDAVQGCDPGGTGPGAGLVDGHEQPVVGRGPLCLLPPRAVGERDSVGVTDTEGVGRVQQGLKAYRAQLAPLLRRDPAYDVLHGPHSVRGGQGRRAGTMSFVSSVLPDQQSR